MDPDFFLLRFFARERFLLPRSYPGCILPVRHQNQGRVGAGLCYACVIIDSIFCYDHIRGDAEELSLQQFLDHYYPIWRRSEPGSTIFDAVRYIREEGLCTALDIPWTGVLSDLPYGFEEMNRRYINGYELVTTHAEVIANLNNRHAIVADVIMTPSMETCLRGRRSQEMCRHSRRDLRRIRRNPSQFGRHLMIIIGYGDGYWTVKNSWGTGLGFFGFHHIYSTHVSTFFRINP